MRFLHPVLETKIFMIAAGLATYSFTIEALYFVIAAIICDYILRMITAGLTFNYKGYPHQISKKKMNTLHWVSTILVCSTLWYLANFQ